MYDYTHIACINSGLCCTWLIQMRMLYSSSSYPDCLCVQSWSTAKFLFCIVCSVSTKRAGSGGVFSNAFWTRTAASLPLRTVACVGGTQCTTACWIAGIPIKTKLLAAFAPTVHSSLLLGGGKRSHQRISVSWLPTNKTHAPLALTLKKIRTKTWRGLITCGRLSTGNLSRSCTTGLLLR